MTDRQTTPECGWEETTTGEPCQNTVDSPEDYCHLHGPDGEIPDGHGAPEGNSGGVAGRSGPPGNDNAVGNAGGAPPEGNQNALSHGLTATPVKLFDWLLEEDREAAVWILNKLYDYAKDAPKDVYAVAFDPERMDNAGEVRMNLTAYGDDLLHVCIRDYARWRAAKRQLQDGIISEQEKLTSEGVWTTEDSNPVNLDLDRMDKTQIRQKDKLGLLPAEESNGRGATLASALSGEGVELGELAREALNGDSDDD